MNNWKTSLYAQILYVVGMGAGLLIVPNLLLGILGMELYDGIWIRVLGMIVLTLILYYRYAIQSESLDFVRLTVWARLMVGAGLIGLALYYGKHIFILLGGLEAGLATWTWFAIPKKV